MHHGRALTGSALWPPDLLSIEVDRAATGALTLALLYAQPQQAPRPGVPMGAISQAAALRPPPALLRAACELLRQAVPLHACLAPCALPHGQPLPAGAAASLHQAAAVSPLVLLRSGALGGGAALRTGAQPWVGGWELAGQGEGEDGGLRWGLGLLDNATMGARRVALALLRLPQCAGTSNTSPSAIPSSLPWTPALASGAGAVHVSVVPAAGPGPNAAWMLGPASPPLPPATALLSSATLGTGLARALELRIAALPHQPPARLALALTLPATAFMDLDELRAQSLQLGLRSLVTFTSYIEIEQPAAASTQHVLLLVFEAPAGGGWSVRLPLHLRHAAPGCAAALAMPEPPDSSHSSQPWATLPGMPRTLYSDGSALLTGSGNATHFPRFGGCFRVSPAPSWEAFWQPLNASGSYSSMAWHRLQAPEHAGAPCLVPVGGRDDRGAVDAVTQGAFAVLVAVLAVVVLLLQRQRSKGD